MRRFLWACVAVVVVVLVVAVALKFPGVAVGVVGAVLEGASRTK
jgi:hypothetical protein